MQRTFIFGDSWCYYKFYIGFKEADKFIKKTLFPLAESLLLDGSIDKWFFIRYNDPNFHLRFRFCIKNNQGLINATTKLNEELQYYVSNNIIWKVQIDTYQREIERYGIENIENSEKIFFYDSDMIAKILSLNINDTNRELISFKMIDSKLNAFNLDIQKKLSLLRQLQLGYKKEFNINGSYNDRLSNRYRELKSSIEDVLSDKPNNKDLNKYIEIVYSKEIKIRSIAEEISNSIDQEVLTSLIKSHIHMMINRFFRTQQRTYELVIYDFLSRYYSSFLARNK